MKKTLYAHQIMSLFGCSWLILAGSYGTSFGQVTGNVNEDGKLVLSSPESVDVSAASIVSTAGLLIPGDSPAPFAFFLANSPTSVELGAPLGRTVAIEGDVVLSAGYAGDPMTAENDLTFSFGGFENNHCGPIAVDHLYGRVQGNSCSDQLVDFGRVVSGDELRAIDKIAVHARGSFLVTGVSITGTDGTSPFSVPVFEEFSLNHEDSQTFDVLLDAWASPGVYSAAVSFTTSGVSGVRAFELFEFRAEIVSADCDVDGTVGILDANCTPENQLDRFLASYGTLRGDADGKGGVNTTDFLTLSRNFGEQGQYTDGDFDKDGTVATPDFLLLSRNFGQGGDFSSAATLAVVPEPNSVTLIPFATVAVLAWLRRAANSSTAL